MNSFHNNEGVMISEETLINIFRHHQRQLPQGMLSISDHDRNSSSLDHALSNGEHQQRGSTTLAVVDGSNIDSALILGDRPTSSSRQERSELSSHERNQNSMPNDETAAATLPHTSSLLNNNGVSLPRATSHVQDHDQKHHDEHPVYNYEIDASSACSLAALTSSLLASRDIDGRPVIKNKKKFLMSLDHQLLTIESCVQEASTMALTTIGNACLDLQ